jgi:hypothetical protein
MYWLAAALLLVSAPAFAQTKTADRLRCSLARRSAKPPRAN